MNKPGSFKRVLDIRSFAIMVSVAGVIAAALAKAFMAYALPVILRAI